MMNMNMFYLQFFIAAYILQTAIASSIDKTESGLFVETGIVDKTESGLYVETGTASDNITRSLLTAKSVNANDADFVKWSGRYVNQSDGSVLFDWVGISASITLDSSVTYVLVNINDNCQGGYAGGGSRWLVTVTTANEFTSPPNHRVSTFYSSPFVPTYVMWTNQGGKCDPQCNYAGNTTFTLTRITESRVSVCDGTGNLSVVKFTSDGNFLPPPPPRTRMVEFIGDSISAGDLNDGATDGVLPSRCGNIAMNDDITYTSGAQLCLATTGLNCDAVFAAWGGIDLVNMFSLYHYTWGNGLLPLWKWSTQPKEPDAVVINLGTNDRPVSPALEWQKLYVNFVMNITQTYNNPPTFFLAYGPMTDEYEPFVVNVTKTLTTMGYKVAALDLTLAHPMTGCFGHPSFADNIEIAAKAKPQVASVMNWT
jgi:hypothetical protein